MAGLGPRAKSLGLGRTVYFLGVICEVENDDNSFGPERREACLVGLFDVEEFCPYEPSNYVYSPYYLVSVHGVEDGPCYAVPAENFLEQTNPKSYAHDLVREREMDFYEEDEDKEV